jgi:hypothetical protein
MAGNALGLATVKRALTRADVVIQSLGVAAGLEAILKPTQFFSKATRVLVTAMEELKSWAARPHALEAPRQAARAASFFVASGLRRIGCSEKGCSMGCPWNAVSVCWAGFQAVMTMRVFCKRGNRFRCPCRCKYGAGCTGRDGLHFSSAFMDPRRSPVCTEN